MFLKFQKISDFLKFSRIFTTFQKIKKNRKFTNFPKRAIIKKKATILNSLILCASKVAQREDLGLPWVTLGYFGLSWATMGFLGLPWAT
jgi:hypothetical protein